MAVPLDILARRGGLGGHGNGDGGDGSVRWCCGERDRGRGREQRVRERSEELRGVVVASPGGAGEAGGGAGACSAAVRCPLLCLLAKVGGDWHGPGGPAQPGKWPVAFLSLSLFHLILFFYFSVSVGLY